MKLTAGLLVIAALSAAGCGGQSSTHYTLVSQRQGVLAPAPWKTVRTRSIVCDSNTKVLCSAISYYDANRPTHPPYCPVSAGGAPTKTRVLVRGNFRNGVSAITVGWGTPQTCPMPRPLNRAWDVIYQAGFPSLDAAFPTPPAQ